MQRAFRLFFLFTICLSLTACVTSQMYKTRTETKYPAIGQFVSPGDKPQHVIIEGEGVPVLMIHGASANAREYLISLAPELEDKDLKLLMADRTGHGYSARLNEGSDLGQQAKAMAGILAEHSDEPAIIVGHSFGGAVALRLALDYPEQVRAIVLLSPATHDWGDGGVAWYNSLAAMPLIGPVFSQVAPLMGPSAARSSLEGLFSPASPPPGYADRMGVDLLFRPATFRHNALDMTRLKPQLAEQQKRYPGLSVPVIVFSGSYDTVLKPKLHAARLRRDAPDKVILVRMDDEGHMPHHGKAGLIARTIQRLAKGESVQETDFETPNG